MLTGDKLETATCIAKSSKLVSRTQTIHTFRKITNRSDAHLELNAFRRKNDCALVITGESLQVCVFKGGLMHVPFCMGGVTIDICLRWVSLQEWILFKGIHYTVDVCTGVRGSLEFCVSGV